MSRVNTVVLVLVSLVATSSLLAQGGRRTGGFAGTEDTGNIYLPGLFATLLGFPSC